MVTATATVPELVAGYRAQLDAEPELHDGTLDLAMWLVEDTADRTWTPSELAKALGVNTIEAHDALRQLVAEGHLAYADGDRGARTRYTARRR